LHLNYKPIAIRRS